MDAPIIGQIGRECSKCGEVRDEADFIVKRTGRVARHCGGCRTAGRRRQFTAWRIKHPKRPPPPQLVTVDGRLCSSCKNRKPIDAFGPDKRTTDGLSARCRDCANEAFRRWYAENIDHARDAGRAGAKRRQRKHKTKPKEQMWRQKLKREYGLTPEGFDAILAGQNGCCAICRRQVMVKTHVMIGKEMIACVDHDHATGRVRGILCANCNFGIGLFRDDPALLTSAIAYLSGGK